MKKPLLISILISLIVMLVLPMAVVMLIPGESSMSVMMILFYVINPLSSIGIGLLCSGHAKKLWPMPILHGLLFWIGMIVTFTTSEPAFGIYGALYALVGLIALGLFHLYKKYTVC